MQALKDNPVLKTMAARVAEIAEQAQFADASCECRGIGWLFTASGAKPCRCKQEADIAQRLARIDDEYRGYTLETIQPDASRHPKQADLIAKMRNDPSASFAFFGQNGIGKTLFGWLLYRRAVEDGRFAIAVKTKRLLDSYRRAEFDADEPLAITADVLLRAKTRYFVFLDEIGVASPSAYAGAQFYDLMDAIYVKRHQLVVTSHSTVDALVEHWGRSGDRYGVAILRRILELDGMIEVGGLFTEERS